MSSIPWELLVVQIIRSKEHKWSLHPCSLKYIDLPIHEELISIFSTSYLFDNKGWMAYGRDTDCCYQTQTSPCTKYNNTQGWMMKMKWDKDNENWMQSMRTVFICCDKIEGSSFQDNVHEHMRVYQGTLAKECVQQFLTLSTYSICTVIISCYTICSGVYRVLRGDEFLGSVWNSYKPV